jgi:glucose/arabinose dehydrogenase
MKKLALVLALGLAACGEKATLPLQTGAEPQLPQPSKTLIPTVKVAPAKGWPEGTMPKAVAGGTVTAFAKGLDHPRWVYTLPNGDVLVAESAAPKRPEEGKGVKAKVMGMMMKKAGSAVPSANRITLLRDADGDGIAELRTPFIEGLNSPFGMTLVGNDLYVANTDAVVRFKYSPGATRIDGAGEKVADLPAGPRNHHWTKSLAANDDGSRLYAGVGSNSNVAEHGMAAEEGRAAIWEIDPQSGEKRLYAGGLRNPTGLAWENGRLWAIVNERDELGSDLVPDYLTSVAEGGFYGWPYSYYGPNVDKRVEPQRPDLVGKAIKPDYALGSHVAPLGMAMTKEGAYIGQHGSWNRRPPSGYNVVFVPFKDGKPSGKPQVVLEGFLSPDGDAWGRPVGVAIDKQGALLVADDVGNTVWRLKR